MVLAIVIAHQVASLLRFFASRKGATSFGDIFGSGMNGKGGF